jgi:hypothetical protein
VSPKAILESVERENLLIISGIEIAAHTITSVPTELW